LLGLGPLPALPGFVEIILGLAHADKDAKRSNALQILSGLKVTIST
jgi:hypothetical protein